jgi:hypothetical protein
MGTKSAAKTEAAAGITNKKEILLPGGGGGRLFQPLEVAPSSRTKRESLSKERCLSRQFTQEVPSLHTKIQHYNKMPYCCL